MINTIYQVDGDTLVLNVTLSVTENHGTVSMLQPLKSAEDMGNVNLLASLNVNAQSVVIVELEF